MTRLPSGTRRAAGGDPTTAQERRDRAADIGAEHQREGERRRQMRAAASAITSSTDREARMHEPGRAPREAERHGSPASPVSSERNSGDPCSGAAARPSELQREQHQAEADRDARRDRAPCRAPST